MSIGNWSCVLARDDVVGGARRSRRRWPASSVPSSLLASAAAFLMRASATICAGSRRVARDREVLDRTLRLRRVEGVAAGTRTSPMVSCSMRYSMSVTSSFLRRCVLGLRASASASDGADDDVGHGACPRPGGSSRRRSRACPSATASLISSERVRAARRRCRAGARGRRARRRSSPGDAASTASSRCTRRTAGTIGAIMPPDVRRQGGCIGVGAVDRGAARRRTRRGRARR